MRHRLLGVALSLAVAGAGMAFADPARADTTQEIVPYSCEVVAPDVYGFCDAFRVDTTDKGVLIYVAQDSPRRTCRHRVDYGGNVWSSPGGRINPTSGYVATRGIANFAYPVPFVHYVRCGPSFTGTVTGTYLIETTT